MAKESPSMYNYAKRKEEWEGKQRVKGEGVPMPHFSSISRKLQTTGTGSAFDETGTFTSLFMLQIGDNPCYRPRK